MNEDEIFVSLDQMTDEDWRANIAKLIAEQQELIAHIAALKSEYEARFKNR